MFIIHLFALAVLFACSSSLFATTREVPSDYDLIQSAIDASSDGDTVLVAQGTYFENINFHGRSIVVMSHYALNTNPEEIWNTIIDGSQPLDPDTASCVRIISGEDTSAVLEGFTITGGTGTPWFDNGGGGGVFIEGGGLLIEDSSPTILNNYIVANAASRTAPGIVSSGGGGIKVGFSSARFVNNVIIENDGKYGGGICINYASPTFLNNVIVRNTGGQGYAGGGLAVFGNNTYHAVFDNNVVAGNSSVLPGGGIKIWGGTLQSHNNIIWGNRANSGAQQISGSVNSAGLTYSCVQGGWTGTGNISDYPEFFNLYLLLMDGSPCIDAGDPNPIYNDGGGSRADMGIWGGPLNSTMFLFPSDPHLYFSSDTVDFGEVAVGVSDTAWLPIQNRGIGTVFLDSSDGNFLLDWPDTVRAFNSDTLRFVWTPAFPGELSGGTTIYHNDPSLPNPHIIFLVGRTPVSADEPNFSLPREFSLSQNYPNPFNPSTTIPFALPVDSRVTLSIYDLNGRIVELLLDKNLSAGYHHAEWNAESFATGTYFCKLETESFRKINKLLLIK